MAHKMCQYPLANRSVQERIQGKVMKDERSGLEKLLEL